MLTSAHRATFCTAFATHSLESLPHPTIVLNVFLNIIVCTLFTGISFLLARPPLLLHSLQPTLFKRMSKQEAISVCFCGPAKTQALGLPLVATMWKASDDRTRALIQMPMVLYTAEQILVAQVLVNIFKRWIKREEELEEKTQDEEGVIDVGKDESSLHDGGQNRTMGQAVAS
jgi:solute carrier family 10 (sodium/bile acid cotransporter), member 7